jgi:thiol:disulfide interchange protein DsbA
VKFIKQFFAVVLLLCATGAYAAPELGEDYTVLSSPQPRNGSKIEVIEFFFYGCSHCYKLHPFVDAWEKKLPKDVTFSYVPAVFNATWEVSARAFYALEALGLRKQVHDALFDAWNKDNLELTDEFSTTEFLAKHGVDRKKFGDAYNSFSVQSSVMRAKQLGQTYGIRGTPTIIVDGKYVVPGDTEKTVRVLEAVVEMARKDRAGKK